MRVHDTLRITRGARGVAHRRCGTLVEFGVGEARLLGIEEIVVGQNGSERTGVAATGHDDGLNRRQFAAHLGEQRDQRRVDDDDLVFGVVDDVAQLLREESDVQRVEHRTH